MRILVTGATGFVGSWVARELLSRGHVVRAFVRRSSRLANLDGLAAERAEGDVLDRGSVERALDGCEAVVHSAGVVGFGREDRERMYAVNARAVEIVLGAALAAGVRRAVFTSSVGVMGGSFEPRVGDESTPSNAEELGIDYLTSKWRGEQAALQLAAKGLPLVVVRPAVVLGPGDRYGSSATTFLALARRQLPFYVRGGPSFCDVRDVARGHAEALLVGRPGEVYILGGHNLEMDDLMRRLAEISGVRPPRRVPYALALAAATVAEAVSRLARRPAGLPRQLLRASRLYSFVSSEKAKADLGYFIRPFEESLRDTLRFFIAEGRLRPATPELKAMAA